MAIDIRSHFFCRGANNGYLRRFFRFRHRARKQAPVTMMIVASLLMQACSHLGGSVATGAAQPTKNAVAPIRPFILVADLDRSLAFYRDLLQFKVLLVADYDNDKMRKFIPMPANSTPKVAIMSENGDDLAFSIVAAAGVPVDRAANRINAPQFVIDRSGLAAIHQAAISADIEVVFPPQESVDANGRVYARELGLVDPDGLRILLIEKIPALPATSSR